MNLINAEGLLVEHEDATDYQVATAALAGWRVTYDDRVKVKYHYVVHRPDGGAYNRYYGRREAWTAAFEAMETGEDNYLGGN